MPTVPVEGRNIWIKTGDKSQSVKICTPLNEEGKYARYYRITPPKPENSLVGRIEQCHTMQEVVAFLEQEPNSEREHGNEKPSPFDQLFPLSNRDPADANTTNSAVETPLTQTPVHGENALRPDDPWLPVAVRQVETAIDALILDFLQHPYLHRVEHSIHAEFFHQLASLRALAGIYSIGNTGFQTQLVHKEWPETIPRPGKGRGNFDIAILSPQLLRDCRSLVDFRNGNLWAPIAMELGLDYTSIHLQSDAEKLVNSQVPFGYLIHLDRKLTERDAITRLVETYQGPRSIKIGYACACGPMREYKLVNDPAIRNAMGGSDVG